MVGTVAYISKGVEHASAVQYGITDCDRVIRGYNQSRPDKKSGRGGWERRGALAGFYGTCTCRSMDSLQYSDYVLISK